MAHNFNTIEGTEVFNVNDAVQGSHALTLDDVKNFVGGDKFHTNIVGTAPYDPLLPLTGWVAPSSPIASNTVEVKFTDGTVGNYTFDGTDWVLDFVYKTLAQHDLRLLTDGTIERGSDSATDPKGAQFLHNGHSHLNGFYDSWIGSSNNMIYQIKPVRDAQNVVTFTKFGDAQINDVYVGKGIGDVASNTVVGGFGLRNNSGNNNTAIGFAGLYLNTTGYSNTAVGAESQAYSTTGRENSSLGHNALSRTNGNGNTAMGFNAHTFGGTSNSCVAIGTYALYQNTGSYNVGVGQSTLFQSTGDSNIAVGSLVLSGNTTGYQNVSIGGLLQNTVGYQNVTLGNGSMGNNISGFLNTSIGHASMLYNTTGARNTAVGESALFENTTASGNTAVGRESSRNNSTGELNVSVGYGSNQTNNGSENVILGQGAMINATLANNNTVTGKSSMVLNLTGNNNATLGRNSLFNTKVSNYNTAVGTEASFSLISSINSIFLTPGNSYTITSIGTTDFTLIGAASNTVGLTFTATGAGTGTGQASSNMPSDFNTVVGAQGGATFYEGQNNTIVGARIQGDYYMNNTVILGDGEGNVRYQSDANGANFLNGSVKIGDSATAPTPGTIRYNATTDKFQGFTSGSGWVDLH